MRIVYLNRGAGLSMACWSRRMKAAATAAVDSLVINRQAQGEHLSHDDFAPPYDGLLHGTGHAEDGALSGVEDGRKAVHDAENADGERSAQNGIRQERAILGLRG